MLSTMTLFSQTAELPSFLLAKVYKTTIETEEENKDLFSTPLIWVDGQIFKLYFENGSWEEFNFLDKRTVHVKDEGKFWQHIIQDQESGERIVFHVVFIEEYSNLRMITLKIGDEPGILMECEVLNYHDY